MTNEELVKEMDRVLEYVSSINDERDSVPILLRVRELWTQLRSATVETKLSRNRKDTSRVPTGVLRWRGRILEQQWQQVEIETDEYAGEARVVSEALVWLPVPEADNAE